MNDVRLSRGLSHDFVTRLENAGLDSELAQKVVQSPVTVARAMVFASGRPWATLLRGLWIGALLQIDLEEAMAFAPDLAPTLLDPAFLRSRRIAEIPESRVTVGELVERALKNQALFYMPSCRECPILPFGGPPRTKVRMSRNQAPESYWFWIEMSPRLIRGPKSTDMQRLPTVEELKVAFHFRTLLGWDLYLEPDDRTVEQLVFAPYPDFTAPMVLPALKHQKDWVSISADDFFHPPFLINGFHSVVRVRPIHTKPRVS